MVYTPPPHGTKFLHFRAVFGKKINSVSNSIPAYADLGGGAGVGGVERGHTPHPGLTMFEER